MQKTKHEVELWTLGGGAETVDINRPKDVEHGHLQGKRDVDQTSIDRGYSNHLNHPHFLIAYTCLYQP